MKVFSFSLLVLGLLTSSVFFGDYRVQAKSPTELDAKIQKMIDHSLPRMACNMSVVDPGAIIASPENKEPDYYYHWIRDSALIVDSLTKLLPFEKGTKNEKILHKFMNDFSLFSEKLQNSKSEHGLGEVRFHPDGSVDTSKWPRPQYDGPALRAMALMSYLNRFQKNLSEKQVQQMKGVIRRDLDAVAQYYNTKGFDLWEYSNGFHFHTRMVQLSALEKGQRFFANEPRSSWKKAEKELRSQVARHWNAEKKLIRFNDGPATTEEGTPVRRPEDHYDTSIVLAVNHAALAGPDFDNMDPRVWVSLRKLEEYFQHNFPANAGKKQGFGVGRHPGDGYYGGNSFFFLTAGYSEHNFRIAEDVLSRKGKIIADELRHDTLEQALQRPVKMGEEFVLPNKELSAAFAKNGDAFLQTMLDVIPADGMMAEQFSKKDGSPASAKDLTWSYGSLLTAVLEREKLHRSSVDFSRLNFKCPLEKTKRATGASDSDDGKETTQPAQ